MNELLRFQSKATDGINILFPPTYEFVFYEDRFTLLQKGKFVRTVLYSDISEIAMVKTWQTNVIINCKPFGVTIHKVSDDIFKRIKEITKR